MAGNKSNHRHGSASFATYRDYKKAGMLTQKRNSLFVGFHGKKCLWYSEAGGWLIVGGARSGKMRDLLAYNILSGIYSPSCVFLDMKGEGTYIGQDQTADNKHLVMWNPSVLHGLPSHRINPVGYINDLNLNLQSDVKMFCKNFIPVSGSSNGEFFELRAQEFLEAVILTLVKMKGQLTLADIVDAINLIPSNSEAWLDFAFEMAESGYPLSKRIEEEIANSRDDNTGGFTGILGVLFKGFACLSDDRLLASVSAPFNFDLADMCSDTQAVQLSLMPPAEFVDGWSPVIKAIFVALFVHKSRNPQSPQQTWFLDEAAQLGKFPLLIQCFTYGAGIGARPVAIYQSTKQMAATGENAENIITSSAQLRTYMGIRDLETATTLSNMMGNQTLDYQDDVQIAQAQQAKRQAIMSMINGNDPVSAAMQYSHHKKDAKTPRQMKRRLMEANEILHMPSNKMIFFTDSLSKPAYANRRPYYEQRWMAGRYHPSVYHPPLDKVRVKKLWGYSWRKVIKEQVQKEFENYPQYMNGTWSRVKD